MDNIRNFVIIAHIDHGKSTLADRFLEVTGTVEKRQMQAQYLDQMDLERERGITIKMTPVRMIYQYHSDRGLTLTSTRTNADNLIYEDLTYKIRGAIFAVKKQLGLGHKENIYQKALEQEFSKAGLSFEREKGIDIIYDSKKIGVYRPDFVIENKVIIELKSLPFIGQTEEHQLWTYLKGSPYRLALLVNFAGKDVDIKRVVYDTARFPRESASSLPAGKAGPRQSAQVEDEYILNLIDTPGHSDFGYEVSRALAAVEGAILLVDATQGIQAQTLSNFSTAQKVGLKIIGAVNKIDVASPEQVEATINELAELIGAEPEAILKVSGKTGAGVEELLSAVIERVPPPSPFPKGSTAQPGGISKILRPPATSFSKGGISSGSPAGGPPPLRKEEVARALVFDSQYDEHKGVIAFIRVFSGSFSLNKDCRLIATGAEVKTKGIGYLKPNFVAATEIKNGEIGFIATGIKDPDKLKIGDTLIDADHARILQSNADLRADLALPGYKEPKPVVFVSFYPENADDYDDFKKALAKLRLSDSAIQFEPDASEVLGRGFKGGFLGRLHFEIAAERILREFRIPVITSFPSVAYRIMRPLTNADNTRTNAEKSQRQSAFSQRESAGFVTITNPGDFPADPVAVEEPMTSIEILTPLQYLGPILQLKDLFRLSQITTKPIGIGVKMMITAHLPLADLISDFDDKLKSVSQGFGSLNYEIIGYEKAEVDKLEILVAEQVVAGLTRILPKADIEHEGRVTCERLKELLPKQQFTQAIQARYRGRIIARETIAAMRKELGNFGKTGGDRTRKMKLWKKQQRGKERLQERGVQSQLRISANVFKELLKK